MNEAPPPLEATRPAPPPPPPNQYARNGIDRDVPAAPPFKPAKTTSDGATASYYELPEWARELADLIRHKQMNGSQAEMFRAIYRGAEASHSDERRQARKVLTYAIDEVVRTHYPERSIREIRDAVFEVIDAPSPQ